MASDLHTYRCRCEGKKKNGSPCRKTFFMISILKGETTHKCSECGHMNHFYFTHIGGHQFINGERAEKVQIE